MQDKWLRFNVDPMGKPRMVRGDQWKRRPVTTRYWSYKQALKLQMGRFMIPDKLEVVYYIPMPPSWSRKKRDLMRLKPHQQTPDIDNLDKAVLDCLCDQGDAYVHSVVARKFWADEGYFLLKVVPRPENI